MMTTAAPLARLRRPMKARLPSGAATRQLHHQLGHDLVDYLEALETFERENGTLPAECRLIVSAKNSEILHAAFGEYPVDVL